MKAEGRSLQRKVFKTLLLVAVLAFAPPGFKEGQMKYPRVKSAYAGKWPSLQAELKAKGFSGDFALHLRHYKQEKQLEAWVKSRGEEKYQLLKTFSVCAVSGVAGPKRREGDLQVPEGFYEISWFNPMSDYHLGLKINYPNQSDRILAGSNRPGGDIMIHGNCVTIGCIPIEDEAIEELYVLCVEAKNNNHRLTVSMFPCRFTEANWKALQSRHPEDKIRFWEQLKKEYDHFELSRKTAAVKVNKNGAYEIQL